MLLKTALNATPNKTTISGAGIIDFFRTFELP
jgi:hypothetical protein